MRGLGTFLGKNLFSNLTLQYDPEIDPFFGPEGVFTDLTAKFTQWQAQLAPITLPDFDIVSLHFDLLMRRLTNFATSLPDRIRPFMSAILSMWEGMADFFTQILTTVNDSFNTIIVPKLTEFSEFVGFIIDQVRIPVDNAISAIGGFFNDVAEFFNNLIESINGLIFSIPNAIAGLGGGTAGGTNVTQNFFEGAIQTGQDVVDQIFNFGGQVGKSINETLSGRG